MEARQPYDRVYVVLPQDLPSEIATNLFMLHWDPNRNTVGGSFDDAGIGEGLSSKTAIFYGIATEDQQNIVDFYGEHYPDTTLEFREIPSNPDPPSSPAEALAGLVLGAPFSRRFALTSRFNDPRNYANGLHEGADFDIYTGAIDSNEKVLCGYEGFVHSVPPEIPGYGKHCVIKCNYQHPVGGWDYTFYLWYCHLDSISVRVGDRVSKGTPLGEIGDTGGMVSEHVHINLQLESGRGLSGYYIDDVWDPVPYISMEPQEISPVGFGLHGPADPSLTASDISAQLALGGNLYKVSSNVNRTDLASAIHSFVGVETWIVRAFLDFGGRNLTAQDIFTFTINDVRSIVEMLPDGVEVIIELLNEVNLNNGGREGYKASWWNPLEFEAIYLQLIQMYRTILPDVKISFPGLSPGASSDDRWNHADFINGCRNAVEASDVLGIHVYMGPKVGDTISNALSLVDWYSTNFPNKPIYITESSIPYGNYTEQERAGYYRDFYEGLKTRLMVKGVAWFVSSASDPSFTHEVLAGTDVPRILGEMLNGD
jgi:hypothetical protein